MAISINQQFSPTLLHGEAANCGSAGLINERISLPVIRGESGLRTMFPRVSREGEDCISANLTIARRIDEDGYPVAGLRLTLPEEVRLTHGILFPDDISPFSGIVATDDDPESVLLHGTRNDTLVGEPAIVIISGLQSVLINKYARNQTRKLRQYDN